MTDTALEFWRETGEQMDLRQDPSEEAGAYALRVLRSALSRWAQIMPHLNEQGVSVMQLRQRIHRKYEDYAALLPIPGEAGGNLEEEIYQTLLANGAFYHRAHNLQPARHKRIGTERVSLIRGLGPEERTGFSGLAPFTRDAAGAMDVAGEYDLWKMEGRETLALIWAGSTAAETDSFDEYLDLSRTEGKTYTKHRTAQAPFALARNRTAGRGSGREYYVIQGEEARRIPEQFLEASLHEYLQLFLMNQVIPPKVTAVCGPSLVRFETEMKLPEPDLRFVRYVAWPMPDDPESLLRFSVHPDLWPVLKDRFIHLGLVIETD